MRWDFFRYLLDIQGLTMAGSKDGGGHEISGHKDKDKSQPQLLSSRNLHHHHHHQQQQHIVSTPSPSSTNNSHHHHHHHHEEVVGDKKSPHSHSTLPSSDKSISLSSSLPTKTATTATNPGDTNSPSLTNDNDNDTIAILDDDDTIINHNVQEKKTIILSPSLWHNKNYTVINYKGNKATPNQSPIPPPSNLIRKDNDKNCNNTLPSTNYDCLKTVTVNINYNRNNSETNHNQGPPRAENNLSSTGAICLANVNNPGPSPKINGNSIIIAPHFKNNGHHYQPEKSALSHQNHYNEQSFSSSTDSNKAEANNRNGFLQQGGLEQGQVDDGPATEDEASSIASSDHNNVSGSGNSSSSGDIISNSAENHQTPSALLISSVPVVVPPTYRSLRWTRAVANQEWSHSLPRTQQILRPIILVGDGCRNTCDYDVESCRTHSPSGIKRREGGCGGGGEGVVKTKRNENDTNITTICAVVGDKNTKIVDVSTSTAPLTRKKTSTTINSPNTTNTTTLSTIRKIGSSGNEPRLLLPAHLQRPTSSIIGGNTTGPVAIATTSASGMSGVSVASCGANNTLFLYQDKWRVLFDKFDREGFGEITWTDFLLALRSKEFQLAVEPGKLQLLEDLARVHSAQTNAITFQLFVNIMTGKRSRSFKCAVHQRDREVCSESDFHLLPLGYQSPTGVKRMARLIADEFLTDERDRKYYADHYRCIPPPLFIISITLIELGFFTYYTVWHGEISSSGPLPMDSPFVYRPDKRQEVWRFLFYMVLHAGWVHLMFNLLVQLLVGLPLEMVHGSLRIGCVYMAGVLAGSLGTSVFDPDVYLVGASGGVYALLAAHLANVLLNYNNMEFGLVRLLGVFLIASVDVGFAIYDRYAASPPLTEGSVPPVSYVAHLTGALAGLTIGLLVLKNFEQKLREQLMWWLALGVYAACTLFAILFNIFHPVYPEMITSEFVEIPEKFPHHQIQ